MSIFLCLYATKILEDVKFVWSLGVVPSIKCWDNCDGRFESHYFEFIVDKHTKGMFTILFTPDYFNVSYSFQNNDISFRLKLSKHPSINIDAWVDERYTHL